jgi:hypothetical protein
MTDQEIASSESKIEAARPPLPPFTKETAIQKCAWLKTAGTLAIRKRFPLRIR